MFKKPRLIYSQSNKKLLTTANLPRAIVMLPFMMNLLKSIFKAPVTVKSPSNSAPVRFTGTANNRFRLFVAVKILS